jgi:tRNA (cytidine/uridine-2'-O-)-methyltransferase
MISFSLNTRQPMFEIILFSPQIPPNTGNIIRLSANCGSRLHLVRPLGFDLDEKACRRAGLDYHALGDVSVHDDLDTCLAGIGAPRVFAITTKGQNTVFDTAFRPGDAFLFGSETAGLPDTVHARFDKAARLRLPMRPGNRSLNLANAVSIVIYEAWRQSDFAGASPI